MSRDLRIEATELEAELRELRRDMLETEQRHAERLTSRASGGARAAESVRNLLHYTAMRRRDLRPLQERLERLGLSSLGRSEAHVFATLDAVLTTLARMNGRDGPLTPSAGAPTFDSGHALLEDRARALMGAPRAGRAVRIMVTLGADHACDPRLIRALVERGMDLARINCAHDDPETWGALARSVRAASEATGFACRIQMDLGGPKLRTGPIGEKLRLREGDRLRLARDARPGAGARTGSSGEISPAYVPCTLPGALDALRIGEPVWFDDGKIGGVVEELAADGALVRITRARGGGARLRADKGINLPDTLLEIPALTPVDREDLAFVARHADIVALSFAQTAEDLAALDDELRRHDAHALGVVLKIETKRAFDALPSLLAAALRWPRSGVMIARGDLAVECGYERLAEVQEELLWFCEAAHLPAIWATQVLEGLSKKGMPTRAEITDAAMSERAECVMLNKGPHVIDAVGVLDDILRRMASHHRKKTPALRPLSVSRSFDGG